MHTYFYEREITTRELESIKEKAYKELDLWKSRIDMIDGIFGHMRELNMQNLPISYLYWRRYKLKIQESALKKELSEVDSKIDAMYSAQQRVWKRKAIPYCILCTSTDNKHHANGLCKKCYEHKRPRKNRQPYL